MKDVSPFAEQLSVLLTYSLLRKQEALGFELNLAASTITSWKERGLPNDRKVSVAKAFGIDPAWFELPIGRFRALVINRFRPVELRTRCVESPLLRFSSAGKVAVPSSWPKRPRFKVMSEHVLLIDVPGIARAHGPAISEIVVLACGARGKVILRPSNISVSPLHLGYQLQVPDAGQRLRMDAVGSEQFIAVVCLANPMSYDLREHLMSSSAGYVEDEDLVPLWEAVEVAQTPSTFLKLTVDVVDE